MSNDKRPTHILWQVIDSEDEDKKAFWQRIGAAWAHKKGSGYSIQLDAIPLRGRIQMTERRDDDQAPGADAENGGQK